MNIIRTLLILSAFIFSSVTYAGPVDINSADAQTLAKTIKGVGSKKAAAIVAYRETHGAFKSVNEIVKVKGIGHKLLEKNRSLLIVSNSPDKSTIKK